MPASEGGARSITLEELASITAALDAGAREDDALGPVGLTREGWEAERAAWLSRLATQAAQGKLDQVRRYAELVQRFKNEQFERRKGPSRKHEGPPPVAPSSRLSPLAAPADDPMGRTAPAVAAPPFAMPPFAPASSSRSPLPPAAFVEPTAPPPAFVEPTAPPPAFVEPTAPPLPPPPLRPSMSTVIFDASPLRATLPFHARSVGAPPSPPAAPAPPPRYGDGGGTVPLAPGLTVAAEHALPFAPPRRTDAGDDSAVGPSSARGGPASALPFAPPRAAPPAASDAPPPSTWPRPPESVSPSMPFVGRPQGRPDPAPAPGDWAMPFQRAGAHAGAPHPLEDSRSRLTPESLARVRSLSFVDYVQLCASVRQNPAAIAQVRAHYRLDDPAWKELHSIWQERFQRDPALRARWQALVDEAARGARRG